jgi:hypothetical protein
VQDRGNGVAALRVDIDALSSAELIEYQTLIATLMNRADWMVKRPRTFGNQCRTMLDGARDEKEQSAGMRASLQLVYRAVVRSCASGRCPNKIPIMLAPQAGQPCSRL